MVHETPGKLLQMFLIFPSTRHHLSHTYSIDSILSTLNKVLISVLIFHHLSTVNLNSKTGIKMSKPFGSTPSKSTIDQSPPRIACANMDYSDVVIDVVPLFMVPRYVPTKRRASTPTGKKVRFSSVSKFSNPSGSIQIPSNEIRNIKPYVAVKKPHSMTNLYFDMIKTTDVGPDVVA